MMKFPATIESQVGRSVALVSVAGCYRSEGGIVGAQVAT